MNKKQLVAAMAEKTGMKLTEAAKALNAFIESVNGALKSGESIQLPGFGSFQVRERGEREGVNPATGAKITIPAKKVVKFKAGKALDESIQ
ncbi:MAG: HU family DNA-binding protein [Christensenellales bacterium]|jgi:DNA-binding protein HU-beta|nr:HU family DNA-binding protein [Clostridiales bacterium]